MKERNETIYITSDYSIFKKLLGNRDTDRKRVEDIKNSIEKVGYISNPIIVNENMEIIDGQGRLEVLKEMERPIEYRIVDGIGIEECRLMNVSGRRWKLDDYVESYCDFGE